MADVDDGWGRPRPKFSELLPSTPDPSDDEGSGRGWAVDRTGVVDMLVEDEEPPRPRNNNMLAMGDIEDALSNVVSLQDFPLPGFAGAPCGELSQTYQNQGYQNQVHRLKEFYTIWDDGRNDSVKEFTGVFTCPVTGENYPCGNWKDGNATIVDNLYWYKTKKLAMAAAAAKALDCFSLERFKGTGKASYKRCIDDAYLRDDAPKLDDLHVPPGIALPTPSFSQEVAADNPTPKKPAKQPAKRSLHQWYENFAKILKQKNGMTLVDDGAMFKEPGSDSYSAWCNQEHLSDKLLWTAVFTCPLTGERFPSGTLNSTKESCKEVSWYFDKSSWTLFPWDEGYPSPDIIKVHLVWYKSKKEAMQAAAGRAYDCQKYRDSGGVSSEECCYCKEPPYVVDSTPEFWKLVSDSEFGVRGVARGVGDDEWPQVPKDDRLTTCLDVKDLQTILENESEEYWRMKYKESRLTGLSGEGRDD